MGLYIQQKICNLNCNASRETFWDLVRLIVYIWWYMSSVVEAVFINREYSTQKWTSTTPTLSLGDQMAMLSYTRSVMPCFVMQAGNKLNSL